MKAEMLAFALLLAACGSDPTPAPDAGAGCVPACGPGLQCLGGLCYATRADAGADTAGPTDARADTGAGDVGLACPAGTVDCDGDPGTGCEAHVRVDPTNCGTCGHRCVGRPLCIEGMCVPWPDGGDPTVPGPYQPCAGPGAACRGGTTCMEALAATTLDGRYYCSALCRRPEDCPAYAPDALDCVHTVRLGDARCARRCATPTVDAPCAADRTRCLGVLVATRGWLNLCVP